MMSVAVGTFVDKQHRPAIEEILASIGPKKELWENPSDSSKKTIELNATSFYGKNYGWAVRFRKAGKALLSMCPGKGSFTAQIVLLETAARKASRLKLGRNVKNVLDSAHRFPEGRWLFTRIGSKRDVADAQKLLLLKEPSKTSL
jgi:hypothetical protein